MNERLKNSNELLEEYNTLINDYLQTENISEANVIKDFIIKKATQELSNHDLSKLKGELTQMALRESGKRKMRIYELNAGLYNNTNISQQQTQPSNTNESYNENIIPFEIAGVRVEGEGKTKLTSQNIISLGNSRYEINLSFSKPRGKWVNIISNTNILLEYQGGNVITLLHPDYPDKIIGQIPIRHKREINVGGGRILEQNIFVTIPFKSYDKNIQLDLSFPNR